MQLLVVRYVQGQRFTADWDRGSLMNFILNTARAERSDVPVGKLAPGHNVLDAPRDQRLTDFGAWHRCGNGELNLKTLRIAFSQPSGL
jgi:hypothetical protein